MIQIVNFPTDYLFVKLWDIPLLSNLSNNKDEKPAKCN